jgi:hypothetical protein
MEKFLRGVIVSQSPLLGLDFYEKTLRRMKRKIKPLK